MVLKIFQFEITKENFQRKIYLRPQEYIKNTKNRRQTDRHLSFVKSGNPNLAAVKYEVRIFSLGTLHDYTMNNHLQ